MSIQRVTLFIDREIYKKFKIKVIDQNIKSSSKKLEELIIKYVEEA